MLRDVQNKRAPQVMQHAGMLQSTQHCKDSLR